MSNQTELTIDVGGIPVILRMAEVEGEGQVRISVPNIGGYEPSCCNILSLGTNEENQFVMERHLSFLGAESEIGSVQRDNVVVRDADGRIAEGYVSSLPFDALTPKEPEEDEELSDTEWCDCEWCEGFRAGVESVS